jgi:gamma-glutamyltranspeptidase / glutathione hydrolase
MTSRRSVALAALAMLTLVVAGCTAPATPTPTPTATQAAPAPTPTPTPTPEPALGAAGVSAGHPLAAEAGREILAAGGTALDAAVATAFADAVVQPFASGIGGGGNAVVVDGDTIVNVDFRETLRQSGQLPGNLTGIPGFVAGMADLHANGGVLPWAEVLAPALRLAEEGATVTPYVASYLANSPAPDMRVGAGGTLVQPELAATLRTLQSEGPSAMYTGSLVPALTAVDGIDAESLAAYSVQRTDPPRGSFAGYDVVSASPALAGAALIQQLQIAEARGIADTAPGSGDFADAQLRAWRVAEQSVRTFTDPAFGANPVDRLTDAAANAALAQSAGSAVSGAVTPGVGIDDTGNTTHISVVDDEGRAVSMTNTILDFWGSGQRVGGFFLNNQLIRFGQTPDPVRAGARPVSWSAPSILLDAEGRVVFVVGSPGGRQILNTVAQVTTLWALHRLPLDQAVQMGRFHGESNGSVSTEDAGLADQLRGRGYSASALGTQARFGSVQALAVDWDSGTVSGFADGRRTAGYAVIAPGE